MNPTVSSPADAAKPAVSFAARYWPWLLAGLLSLVCAAIIYSFFPDGAGVDWQKVYRPAALAALAGRSPYDVWGFFNVPWVLLPLIPLALLPERAGYALLAALNWGAVFIVAYQFKAKPIPMALLLFSPHVLFSLFLPNLDWIAAFGFFLPPQIGLFFLLLKPQMGVALALFFALEAWRAGGLREVVRVFAPVTLALLASLALYGLWPLQAQSLLTIYWNRSVWPYGVILGLPLLAAALYYRKKSLAILASPFLSPYVASYTWILPVIGFLPNQVATTAAILTLWIIQYVFSWPI